MLTVRSALQPLKALEPIVPIFDKLAVLLGTKDKQTKYAALNINTKLTSEQRRTLARVFDVIRDNYADEISKEFIETVAAKF